MSGEPRSPALLLMLAFVRRSNALPLCLVAGALWAAPAGRAAAPCQPRLSPHAAPVMAGETIALTGTGFGEHGGVAFGRRYGHVVSYGPSRILVTVPFGVAVNTSTLPVQVFCGRLSPPITVGVAASNQLAVATEQSRGTVAAVIRTPRAGYLSAVVAGTSAVRLAHGPGLVRLRFPLVAGLRQRLAEGEDLNVELAVRFTPSDGGEGRTVTREMTLIGG